MERKQRIPITKQLLELIHQNLQENRSMKDIAHTLRLSYSTVKKFAKSLSEDENYIRNFKTSSEIRRER